MNKKKSVKPVENKLPVLTPEQKLQLEARKLMTEKINRASMAIDTILKKEGLALQVEHSIKIIPIQR